MVTLQRIGARIPWRAPQSAGNAGPRPLRIFHSAHSRLYYIPVGTQRRRTIWMLSTMQALIFIAAVAIAVALLALA
jgi:hypothetical protein